MKHMVKNGMITSLEIDLTSKEEFCEPCAKAKATCKPFPKESSTRATHFGEHVHGICGDQLPQKALEANTMLLAKLMITHIKLKYTSWRKRAKL
jgi:hypothetical protein